MYPPAGARATTLRARPRSASLQRDVAAERVAHEMRRLAVQLALDRVDQGVGRREPRAAEVSGQGGGEHAVAASRAPAGPAPTRAGC